MKTIRPIFSPEAEEAYKYLNERAQKSKIERTILNAINKKIELIKINQHFGEPIAKRLIPIEYTEKYGIKNLFVVKLPNFWRLLYTLTNGESKVEIIAFVLDVFDHDKYNKKFGYRKR